MKLKSPLFVMFYLLVNGTSSAQHTPYPPDVKQLYALLQEYSDVFQDYHADPSHPFSVLFFDIDHDGIPEALGAAITDIQGGGCHGNDWHLFRYEDGKWKQIPSKDLTEYTTDPSSIVYARGDDFFSLTEEGQKPKLILVYSYGGGYTDENPSFDYGCSQRAEEITIDGEGYLKTIPIPELTTNFWGKYNEHTGEIDWEETPISVPEIWKKLVRLPLGVPPQPQNGDGKEPPPTVTAEAQAGKEKPLPTATTETQAEKTAPPRHAHLWLYVGGVLLLTLSALFRLTQKRRAK